MDPVVGKEIDGYRILEVLGRGGMGIVYKAQDIELSKMVALKMIAPELARDELFLRKFRGEGRALARIDSPYIVSVYALRQTGLGLFIVLEYVDGKTLADLIHEQGALSWEKAYPIILQMLTALEHAHSANIIHRDIKPSNIMLTKSGDVKVTDFGLAKTEQTDGAFTVTQGVAGTLNYMSPEQVKGFADLDHRSDLYSMGMTIYELLTGRLPFERESDQFMKMQSIVENPLSPPDRFEEGIPKEVSRVVMKSLEKDPAVRFQTAALMRDAFEALSPRLEAPMVLPKAPDGSILRQAVAGIAAVLVLSLGGFFLLKSFRSEPRTLLRVVSEPDDAAVFMDGTFLGQTPLDATLPEGGAVALRIERPGYASLDTVIRVGDEGWPAEGVFILTGVERSLAILTVDSNPPGASVKINGLSEGTTRLQRSDLQPGVFTVLVEKDGFEPWTEEVVVVAGEATNLVANLEKAARPTPRIGERPAGVRPQPPARATLRLQTHPAGVIRVDNRVTSGTIEVTAEQEHSVACGDPPFQSTTRLRLSSRQQRDVNCYFNQEVVLRLTGANWASITVNGNLLDVTAPGLVQLPVGAHRISVSRHGYAPVLSEQNVTILPTFFPKTDTLSFELRKQ